MSFFKLPYYAPVETLPAPLPSIAEIEASKDVLQDIKIHQRVVRFAPHFVVKHGLRVSLEEGQTMIFIKKNVGLPAPQVYALFQDPANKKNYIIMEYVSGPTLEDLWPDLSLEQKHEISQKITNNVDRMRLAPSPSGFCSLGRLPLRHEFFETRTGLNSWANSGPFQLESELNEVMIAKCFGASHLIQKGRFYRRHLKSVLSNHRPTLTHGDLQRKNIIVQTSNTTSEMHITFLDWESAGWYPSYWEYVMAVRGCDRFQDDWHHWVDQILKPYPRTWIWIKTLMELLW